MKIFFLITILSSFLLADNFINTLNEEIMKKNKKLRDNGKYVYVNNIALNSNDKKLTFFYHVIKERRNESKFLSTISLKNDLKINDFVNIEELRTLSSFLKNGMCKKTAMFIENLKQHKYKLELNISLFEKNKEILNIKTLVNCKK